MNIFITILIFVQASIQSDFECSSLKECYCFEIDSAYEFFCPASKSEIRITVQPGEGANIQCLNRDNGLDIKTKLSYLKVKPFGDFNHVDYLKFQFCSLPTTFFNTIEVLGLNSTQKIDFLYNEEVETIDLNPQIFKNLTSLQELILSDMSEADISNKELKLTKNIFDDLTNLTKLDLTRNGLTYLPTTIFGKLKKLKTLILQSNELANLNPLIFENLLNLEMLDLSFNRFEKFSKNLFYNLTSLKYINLMYNDLYEISKNIFDNNINLKIVHLNTNRLVQVPDYLLANFSTLEEVYLNEAELIELPSHLFKGSNNLLIINLSDNDLKFLPNVLFKGLVNLEHLDLKMNKLKYLPNDLFDSLITLSHLDLQYNSIKSLNKGLFKKLEYLETINLKNNLLQSLDQDLFQNTRNLQEIILADNFLKFPTHKSIYGLSLSPFIRNENLKIIDLSNNQLTQINNDWILNKPYLEELDLSYNEITAISFKNLYALSNEITVDLSHNNISIVDFQDAFETENKTSYNKKITVFLNDNPLNCNCYIYDFVNYFDITLDSISSEVMKIDANDLTCAFPLSFSNNSITSVKLDTLICSFEELEIESCSDECLCSFRPSDSTVIVDCANRNLSSVPYLNVDLIDFNKTEVHLQNNRLGSGPLEGMGYENVTKMFLSSNFINELQWVPQNIDTLELDDNSFSSLSLEAIGILESPLLTKIRLGNNPWICNCSTLNLYNFLITSFNIKSIDVNEIKCNDSDTKISLLNSNKLCPASQSTLYISLSAILVICIITTCFLVLYYQNQHKIKVWLFAHNLFLWFVTEEEIDKDKRYDVFISYSHKDEEFVLNELQKVLENDSFKLCLHIRDWIPGEMISRQIIKSINNSRRTLVVLSPHFMESVWGNIEFHTAHMEAMKEGRARVIVVLYGDVNVKEQLDDDLKAYIETNTYVKWDDPWFWQKLKYALPHQKL